MLSSLPRTSILQFFQPGIVLTRFFGDDMTVSIGPMLDTEIERVQGAAPLSFCLIPEITLPKAAVDTPTQHASTGKSPPLLWCHFVQIINHIQPRRWARRVFSPGCQDVAKTISDDAKNTKKTFALAPRRENSAENQRHLTTHTHKHTALSGLENWKKR